MKQKILLLLLALLTTVLTKAGECTIDGIVYNYEYTFDYDEYTGGYHLNANVKVVDGKTVTGEVVIPAYILVDDGVKLMLTVIDTGAFEGNTAITKVTIPGGISHIYSSAFKGCTSLEEIYIGQLEPSMPSDGLTYIENYAFQDCSSLKRINLPNSVLRIGQTTGGSAFSGCTSLKTLNLPSGLKNIPRYTFNGCTSLETVTVNSSLGIVGEYAFQHCEALKAMDLSNGVGEIGEYAFNSCYNMKSIKFPSDGFTKIGASCFLNCTSLESITIPGCVRTIDNYICRGCTGLKKVVIELGSNRWTGGSNYFQGCTALTQATISWYVELPSSLFKGCTSLKTVVLNNTKAISASVFEGCTALESVSIPNTVKIIGLYAFKGCSAIENIALPNSVTAINSEAFMGCSSLKAIAIPSGVTTLARSTFEDCSSLEGISLPAGLTEIEKRSLWGCSSLQKLDLPPSLQKVRNSAFVNCRLIKSLTFPSTMTTLEPNVFYGCRGLRLIDLRAATQLSIKNTSRDSNNSNLVFRDVPESTVILMPGESIPQEPGTGTPPPAIELPITEPVVVVRTGDGYWCPVVNLTAGEDLNIPVDFVADEVTYPRTIASDANAYTVCLPYDYALPSGMRAYTFSSNDSEGNLVFTEVSAIEANKPYLVTASSTVSDLNVQNVTMKATPATMPDAGLSVLEFRGTLKKIDNATAAGMGAYILQANKEWHPVCTTSAAAYIAAGRAYIVPKASESRLCINTVLDTNDVTGIKLVSKEGAEEFYDLQGRRVDKPAKGVYIVGGKKYVYGNK